MSQSILKEHTLCIHLTTQLNQANQAFSTTKSHISKEMKNALIIKDKRGIEKRIINKRIAMDSLKHHYR